MRMGTAAKQDGRRFELPKTPEDSRLLLLNSMTEAEFQAKVIELARRRGWLVHHDRPAQTSKGYRTAISGEAGFPDLLLIRPPVLIAAELKTTKGSVSGAQSRWIQAFSLCHAPSGGTVRAMVWTPADWDRIEGVLM